MFTFNVFIIQLALICFVFVYEKCYHEFVRNKMNENMLSGNKSSCLQFSWVLRPFIVILAFMSSSYAIHKKICLT